MKQYFVKHLENRIVHSVLLMSACSNKVAEWVAVNISYIFYFFHKPLVFSKFCFQAT